MTMCCVILHFIPILEAAGIGSFGCCSHRLYWRWRIKKAAIVAMFIVNGLWPDRETLLSVACPSSLLHIRLVLIRVMLYRCITVFDCILIIKYMGIGGQQKDDYFVFVHFSSRLAAAAAAAAAVVYLRVFCAILSSSSSEWSGDSRLDLVWLQWRHSSANDIIIVYYWSSAAAMPLPVSIAMNRRRMRRRQQQLKGQLTVRYVVSSLFFITPLFSTVNRIARIIKL